MTQANSAQLERLRWRSRRGLLELELLLLPFIEARLGSLSEELLADFDALLNCEDMDVIEWLLARSEPEVAHQRIVLELRSFLANEKLS
jgi:antitoxin CptB